MPDTLHQPPKPLFSYRPHWAKRLGTAPFLPMSREEMAQLGWDACDVVLVTGDAYIDHPSFGMALIGRLLEAQGFRVGIISQPDWRSATPFRQLGAPRLFWGVTAGNMDSMVNRYTSERKIRSDDAYTPGGLAGRRPDRAVTVYAQRCREAFPGVPVVIGSIEASLRRIAHYDYWSDKVRRSVLLDAKADMLIFGNAERAIVELAHRLAKGEPIQHIRDLRGSAFRVPPGWLPHDVANNEDNNEANNEAEQDSDTKPAPRWQVVDASTLDDAARAHYAHHNPAALNPYAITGHGQTLDASSLTSAAAATSATTAALASAMRGGQAAAPPSEQPVAIHPPRQRKSTASKAVAPAPPPVLSAAPTPYQVLRLPSYEQVVADTALYAHASRLLHLESNPGNARALVQRHGEGAAACDIWLNPPPLPLASEELDRVYELPYARAPHPAYAGQRIPAWEMIRFSVNIMRGCFGGCTFCSITEHEGRIIQSRSEGSILREIAAMRDKTEGFTGMVSDLGGPTANMWRLNCKDKAIEQSCRRLSCVFPSICPNLGTDHQPLIRLYRKARELPGVKRVFIASGLRYDLAVRSPEYIRELVTHHVGGYLKIAPEHIEPGPLAKMMKPGIGDFERFRALFERYSREAGKEQYLIPYFIAAHPGTTDADMLQLALWLKANQFRPDQVQTFLPTPLALATTMYHTGLNPLRSLKGAAEDRESVPIPMSGKQRRLHKAFLRYHDPANWPLLRQALHQMGRDDLIGNSKHHLVPTWQPRGSVGANLSDEPNLRSSRETRPSHTPLASRGRRR